MYDVDVLGLLTREVLRERLPELVAEACAWSVGLSDEPHLVRRHGRVVPGSPTLGVRAESGLPLGGEEDARLELGEVLHHAEAGHRRQHRAEGRQRLAVLGAQGVEQPSPPAVGERLEHVVETIIDRSNLGDHLVTCQA